MAREEALRLALIAAMKYCPICGGSLKPYPSPKSEYRMCDDGCGVLSVTERKVNGQHRMSFVPTDPADAYRTP